MPKTLSIADPEEARLYAWMVSAEIADLPVPPFQHRGHTVIGIGWYEALKRQSQQSLDYLNGTRDRPHPRRTYGALLEDIRCLEILAREEGAISSEVAA